MSISTGLHKPRRESRLGTMNTTPKDETLAELIANRKRDRSYDRLADQSHGVLTRSNLQRMATQQLTDLPTVKVIRALAKVLAVPESRVLAAAGSTVGIAPEWGRDLVIYGGKNLHPESQRMLLDMAEHMRWWSEQAEQDAVDTPADDNVTPLRPKKGHTPDWTATAADSSASQRSEGEIDPERPEDSV